MIQAHSQAYVTLTDSTFPLRLISLKLTCNTHHPAQESSLDSPETELPVHNGFSRASPYIYLGNRNSWRL